MTIGSIARSVVRKPSLITASALMAAMFSVCSPTRGDTSEQAAKVSPASIAAQLVGSWRLVSIYQEDESGYEIDQFGGAPKGFFMTDSQGNFSFQIMSNRSRRLLNGSPPAVVMARFDGLIEATSYFGAYVIDQTDKRLTLHIAQCQFRGCDRSDRTAELAVSADTMEMTSILEPSPTGAFYSYLKWKRH